MSKIGKGGDLLNYLQQSFTAFYTDASFLSMTAHFDYYSRQREY